MDIWAEGQLRAAKKPYNIIRLHEEHLHDVLQLQELVVHGMPNRDEIVPSSAEEVRDLLGENGLCAGVLVNDALVGFHAMYFPGADNEENLGFDLDMDRTERGQVAHLEIAFVLPAYRGNGLQKKMAEALLTHVQQEDKYRYICETVAPVNVASVKNTLAVGLRIIALKRKYGGLIRYIMYRDLKKSPETDMHDHKDITVEDFECQKQLLNDGYIGIDLVKKGERFCIRFAHPA